MEKTHSPSHSAPSIFGLLTAPLVAKKYPPLVTVPRVDLKKFMGIWYVNALLPTPAEKECVNPVEFYALKKESADQPEIENLYFSEKADASGTVKKLEIKAFVTNPMTNAEWGVQFMWPLKMDYKILYVSENYTETLVGHPSRKYLWVMSRNTELPRARVEEILKLADQQGFTREGMWYPPYTPGFQITENRLREIVQGKKLN